MSSVGKFRVRSIGELLPPTTLPPPSTDSIKSECVDLTEDDFVTPVAKRISTSDRIKRTQLKASVLKTNNKDPATQTKLDSFFRTTSPLRKAPKKLLKQLNDDIDGTSVVTVKAPREVKKRTRRKLIKNENEEKTDEKKKDISTPPTVISGVVDLCSDSDEEQDKKHSVTLPRPNRPTTVKSEKSICPSYKVVEGTTFAVDAFKYGRIEGVTAYFLTHFHCDHYIGLTRKFSMPLYLSKITANLMREFIPVDEKLVNILPMNATVLVEDVKVTAIDANHCPGAVMLLFQLPCGKRILHTGDFRACLEMELDPHLSQRNIDLLYLDTTYISDKYSFQPQEKSILDAIELIRNFRERNEGKRVLYVCGSYLVGKEKFWSQVARAFDFKVWTDDKRRKVMRAIDNDEILQRLVADPRRADLHVISMMKIGYKSIYEYWTEFSDTFEMIFVIRPSGWEKNSKPQYRGVVNIIGVEYSEHSSHSELRRFVGFLKPSEVISTVPTGRDLTKCSVVPPSWYRKECFSPIKKQASIFKYLEVKQRD